MGSIISEDIMCTTELVIELRELESGRAETISRGPLIMSLETETSKVLGFSNRIKVSDSVGSSKAGDDEVERDLMSISKLSMVVAICLVLISLADGVCEGTSESSSESRSVKAAGDICEMNPDDISGDGM